MQSTSGDHQVAFFVLWVSPSDVIPRSRIVAQAHGVVTSKNLAKLAQ